MTIRGIGVDILHIPRISALISRRGKEAFAKRILSPEEWQEFRGKGDNHLQAARYLAVRFCVKEAAYKALYPSAKPTWKELTYKSFGRSYPGSKPQLSFFPGTKAKGNTIGNLHVSVSHDGGFVFSTVIVEEP